MMEFFKGTVTRKDWMAVGTILGVALVLAAVFVFFVHSGQRERLTQLDRELTQRRQELKQAQETQQNVDKLEAETLKIDKLVGDFEKRLPDKREMPLVLNQFEKLAGEVGLEFDLTTLEPLVDEHKETIPYGVVAKGDFHKITAFINRLERYDRFFKVSNLNIADQKEGVAEAKFTLSTFSFNQPVRPAGPTLASNAEQGPGGAK